MNLGQQLGELYLRIAQLEDEVASLRAGLPQPIPAACSIRTIAVGQRQQDILQAMEKLPPRVSAREIRDAIGIPVTIETVCGCLEALRNKNLVIWEGESRNYRYSLPGKFEDA